MPLDFVPTISRGAHSPAMVRFVMAVAMVTERPGVRLSDLTGLDFAEECLAVASAVDAGLLRRTALGAPVLTAAAFTLLREVLEPARDLVAILDRIAP